MKHGTPKTLTEAISNGLRDTARVVPGLFDTSDVVALHVKDFLAQKFSAVMLLDKGAEELWAMLFPEETSLKQKE